MLTNNFGKKKYPSSNMAWILKAMSTIGVKVLKPSFGEVRHVRGKLELLNEEYVEKGTEKAPSKADRVRRTRKKA